MARSRPTRWRGASAGSGRLLASRSQCCRPCARWAPPESATSCSTTGLVGSQLAGPAMLSSCRAKKSVIAAWWAVMPGIRAASRQKASVLRKPVRSVLKGQWAQAAWRKRGSSSASPAGAASAGAPGAADCKVCRPSCVASPASSSWRPGEATRCQAQSASASDKDTGDRPDVSAAVLACTRRSRRWKGVSSVRPGAAGSAVGVAGMGVAGWLRACGACRW